MRSGLHMRSQIHTIHTWVSRCTLASTFALCCESMWNLFPYIVTIVFSTQTVIKHLTNIHWIFTVVDITFGFFRHLAQFIVFLLSESFFKSTCCPSGLHCLYSVVLNFHRPLLLSMKDLSGTLEKPGVISIPTATWTPWRWAYGFLSVAVCWLVAYSYPTVLFKGNLLKTEDWPKPESWILNHWLTQLALEVFGLPFISSLGKYIFRWNQRWAIIWMQASNAPWCFHDPQKRAADEIGVHWIWYTPGFQFTTLVLNHEL